MSKVDELGGIAMIAREVFAIHFVCKDDLSEVIDGLCGREGASIGVGSFIVVIPIDYKRGESTL